MSSMARESFLRREARRRRSLAWGGALGLYLVFGLVLALQGIFGRETFSVNSGPILIRIGSPEGIDETSRAFPALRASQPEAPTQAEAEAAAPSPPPPAKPAEAKPQEPGLQAEAPVPVPAKPASVPAKPASVPAKPASVPAKPASVPSAVIPPTRLARDPGATGEGGIEGSPFGVAGGSATSSLKGSENGNSFETNLGGGQSIGRALFVPVYLYMPLPLVVADSIYASIKASPDGFITREYRQLQFRSHYEKTGERWRLKKADVDFRDRPGLWEVLQSGGYDLSQADYKKGNNLSPVVLDFELEPYNPETKSVSLASVVIRSSSGDKDVDEAVLYGFRQGSYSNGSGKRVKASFTYRFD